MNKLTTIVLTGLLGVGLSACSDSSIEDLASDLTLQKETKKECTEMTRPDREASQLCRNLQLGKKLRSSIELGALALFGEASQPRGNFPSSLDELLAKTYRYSKKTFQESLNTSDHGPWEIEWGTMDNAPFTLVDGELGLCWYLNKRNRIAECK